MGGEGSRVAGRGGGVAGAGAGGVGRGATTFRVKLRSATARPWVGSLTLYKNLFNYSAKYDVMGLKSQNSRGRNRRRENWRPMWGT